MDNTMNSEIFEDNGKVNISDEVISVIASLAASEVNGVAGMVSGVADGFAELMGKKSLSKGVKILREGNSVKLDLAIIVEYGSKIPDVSWEIQEKVKNEVESMTGLEVSVVNISVEGINVPITEEQKPQTETAEEEKEATEE